jgi:hypothetical protein
VTRVLDLASFDQARLHRLGLSDPLQCLDAGHLVHADGVDSLGLEESGGRQVGRADALDLEGERLGISGLGVEPIAVEMELEDARFLKSVPSGGARSTRRCHV